MRISSYDKRRVFQARLGILRVGAVAAIVLTFLSTFSFAAERSNGLLSLVSDDRPRDASLLVSRWSWLPEESAALDAETFENDRRFETDDLALFEPNFISPDEIASLDRLALGSPFDEGPSAPEQVAVYDGRSFRFSQDVVMRGSVNLPTLKSLQIWGNGYFGSGHVSPKVCDDRVHQNNSGASIGLNVPLGAATLSAYYNYHRNRVNYSSRRVQQEDDAFGMAFYLNSGGFYVSALGLYGDDDYGARYWGEIPAASSQLRSNSFGGNQTTGYFETGYEMMTLGLFVLKPFGSYQYSNLKHHSFDTTTLGLTDGKRKYNSCLMTLGSRIDVNLAGLDVFTLQGRMAWVTQLRKRNESFNSFCYGRVPGTLSPSQPYFLGSGSGSDYFWGGLGLRLSLMGMLAIAADYDCLVNKYQTLNEGSVGLLFGF